MKQTAPGNMQLRTVLTVGLILFLSFSLGYKRGEVSQFFQSIGNNPKETPAPLPVEVTPPVQPVSAPEPVPPAPAPIAARPMPSVVPNVVQVPAAQPQSFIYPNSMPSVQPSVVPGSLANTLDSVRPAEMSEELKRQRNVYFERLQQQLAEMRQQQSPAAADVENPAANNPAASEGAQFIPPHEQTAEDHQGQTMPIAPPPPGFGQPTAAAYPDQEMQEQEQFEDGGEQPSEDEGGEVIDEEG